MTRIFKILFSVVLLSISMTATAQQAVLNYANLLKLWKLENASDISRQAKQWGYKLIKLSGEYNSGVGTAIWTNSDLVWNSYEGEWYIPKAKSHTEISGIFVEGKAAILSWDFQALSTYNSLKQQVKAAGWTYTDEEVEDDGLTIKYSSASFPSLFLYLREEKNGRYSINLLKDLDDEKK